MREENPSVVITKEDRDFLTPILGGPYMVELMMRDREAWQQVGTLITQAFAAGKMADAEALAGKEREIERLAGQVEDLRSEVAEARMGDDW